MTEESFPKHAEPIQEPDVEQRMAQERGRDISPGRDVLNEQELAQATGNQSTGAKKAAPGSEDLKEEAGRKINLGGREAVIGKDVDRDELHESLEEEESESP